MKLQDVGFPPDETIIPLPPLPLIYVARGGRGGGGVEEGKSVCRRTGELSGFERRSQRLATVMWWPADTHGHHLCPWVATAGAMLTGNPRPPATRHRERFEELRWILPVPCRAPTGIRSEATPVKRDNMTQRSLSHRAETQSDSFFCFFL